MKKATGMARVAGHLNKTISTNTETIGRRAKRDKIPRLISQENHIKQRMSKVNSHFLSRDLKVS
ncbi:MAG: hypothetical protein ACE5L7_07725 [Candidatus Aminicenantales bacterium]